MLAGVATTVTWPAGIGPNGAPSFVTLPSGNFAGSTAQILSPGSNTCTRSAELEIESRNDTPLAAVRVWSVWLPVRYSAPAASSPGAPNFTTGIR